MLECCEKSPKSCPRSTTCEEGVDALIKGSIKIYHTIKEGGGPVYRRPWGDGGWYCSKCEGAAVAGLPCNGYFRYETVLNLGMSTHTWGQIRCKATGKVIGTIDFWKKIDEFYRPGRDLFGWPGENHGEIDEDWKSYCRLNRGNPECIIPPEGEVNPDPWLYEPGFFEQCLRNLPQGVSM